MPCLLQKQHVQQHPLLEFQSPMAAQPGAKSVLQILPPSKSPIGSGCGYSSSSARATPAELAQASPLDQLTSDELAHVCE